MTAFRIGCRIVLVLSLLEACSKKETPPAPSPAPPAAATTAAAVAPTRSPVAEARALFRSRCSVCHGDSGKGDGPAAAALVPKPRDYTQSDWQKATTDEQIRKVILLGGSGVGKSPVMPANADLEAKPAVVDELVKLVRGFGAQ
jgi:mono/diheme cytochrome c family protein